MKYLLILLFLFSAQVFSDNRVKSYTANTIVRYSGADVIIKIYFYDYIVADYDITFCP